MILPIPAQREKERVVAFTVIPMFQVPTNTEITSGSLSWECLVFVSWRSRQNASRFWKKRRQRQREWWNSFRLKNKASFFPYPRTLERHFPRRRVAAVDHHAQLCRTALEGDDLKDLNTTTRGSTGHYARLSHTRATWCALFLLLSCETLSTPKEPDFLSKSSTPASTSTETVCLPYLTIFTWTQQQDNRLHVYITTYMVLFVWYIWWKRITFNLCNPGLPERSELAAVRHGSWQVPVREGRG